MKNFNKIKIENNKAVDIVVNIILGAIVVLGIITSINMILTKRSLWLDEAAFAYSFSQRNLFNLTFGAFEWEQIGPIIYLYIVKIITIIFGNSEITLRLFSFVSYILLILLTYFISKKMFKFKYPLISSAFISSMGFILMYSNEFKPYLFDAVVCLFVILMYYFYKEKKIKLKTLTIIFMISIWASNPSCFFIGGILLYEFIVAIKEKKFENVKKIIFSGICIFTSFAIYYFYWLRQVANSIGMQKFWVDYSFPLIPTSYDDIVQIFTLLEKLLLSFDNFGLVLTLIAGMSIIIGIHKKEKYKIVIFLGIILGLIASYIGKYPLCARLWVFIYPIIIILAFDIFNKLLSENNSKNIIVLFICFIFILSNTGIIFYFKKENSYYNKNEINMTMDYLEKNIKYGEKVYLADEAIPNFVYRYGYDTKTFGKNNNEVIFPRETGMFLKDMSDSIDYDLIKDEEKLYILTQNWGTHLDKNLTRLARNGYLELIMKPYNTPLFYYVKDVKNLKTKVEYSIKDMKIEDEYCIITINIKNIGESIINNRYDDIYLSSKKNTIIHKKIKEELQKDEECDIIIDVKINEIDEFDLQLYCENRYWFEELGIEPLKITKNILNMGEF